jgi:uncharacterized repeat protein (TIGR03806 family)
VASPLLNAAMHACRRGRALALASVVAMLSGPLLSAAASAATDGPALAQCQSTIVAAAASTGRQRALRLQRCSAMAFRCLQSRPDDAACIERAAKECRLAGSMHARAEAKAAAALARACDGLDAALWSPDGLGFDDVAPACAARHGITVEDATTLGTCLARNDACADAANTALLVPRTAEILRTLALEPIGLSCLDDHGGTGARVVDARRVGRPLERCLTIALRDGSRFFESRSKTLATCAATMTSCLDLGGEAAGSCMRSTGAACAGRLAELDLASARVGGVCREPAVAFATFMDAAGGGGAALADGCSEVGVPTLAGFGDWLTCLERRLTCRSVELAATLAPRIDTLFDQAGIPLRPAYCSAPPEPTPEPTATPTDVPSASATSQPTATLVATPFATATPAPTTTAVVTTTVVATTTAVPTTSAIPTAEPTATPVPTSTRTSTPVPTATRTATPIPTPTRTATPVPSATATGVPTTTRTATPVPTATRTATPVATATRTVTPTAIATSTRTATPTPVRTATRTATPSRTATRTASPTPIRTSTPVATATPNGGTCDASGAPYGFDTRVSATSCRLDGNPDQLPAMEVERVFPSLSFSSPIQLTHPPDGTDRVFVVEQGGRIRVFPNGSPASSSEFLAVTGVVAGGEEGLLGLAFHPSYAANGYFYVYYSAGSPRRSVIARYRVSGNPNVADAASRQILLEIPQPYSNHNGGQLAYGPDGMLYIGLGDGGSANDPGNRAQNMNELLGKILRIDVDRADAGKAYAVPPDNPFVGQSGARGEIWAVGLRNPWRMSFDRLTHALWAGDVGQGNWEEIDLIERGGNYGWRRKEGFACYNPGSNCDTGNLIDPLAVYSHSEGCSVTGGFVYRGSRLPELYGAYLYGDYCSGNIWALRYDGATTSVQRIVSGSGLNISSFGEDRDGELYVVHLGGTIHRLRRPSGGQAGTFPRTLTATGCFTDVPNRVPAPELVPYDVRSPLWSDGAAKRRFFVIPNGTTIGFRANGAWDMPVGTILVKEFTLELERGNPASTHALETRFFVRRANGWQGYTYQWNDEQTEAFLLDNGTTKTFTVTDPDVPQPVAHTHVYPSRSDCVRCHTTAAGGTLGMQTGQLNGSFDYGAVTDNQLRTLEHVGFFGGCLATRPASLPQLADPFDATAPLAARARSYLHANCAHCHLPGGPAPTAIDLRAETAWTATGLCDAVPQHGDLGVPGARLVLPGSADASITWLRVAMRGDDQMPPLATLIPDEHGSNLIEAWIDGLTNCQ